VPCLLVNHIQGVIKIGGNILSSKSSFSKFTTFTEPSVSGEWDNSLLPS
ncbi:unnamed protein product, partial [Tenebrio molitor]